MFVFHQGGLSVGCILVVFDWDGLSQGWSFIMASSTTVFFFFFWLCALSEIFDFTIVLQCNRYPLHYACALPTGQDKVFVRILLERNPELIEKKMDKVSILLRCLFLFFFSIVEASTLFIYTVCEPFKKIHKRGDMGSGGLKQDWAQYWPGIILNVLGHGGSQDRLFSLLTSSSGPPSHRIFLNHLFSSHPTEDI